MTKFILGILALATSLAMVFGLAVLMALPVKWLVNYVFTDGVRLALFGVAQIDVWRAFALSFLCGMLFRASSK